MPNSDCKSTAFFRNTKIISVSLRHKTPVLLGTLVFFVASLALLPAGFIGSNFMPDVDNGELLVSSFWQGIGLSFQKELSFGFRLVLGIAGLSSKLKNGMRLLRYDF